MNCARVSFSKMGGFSIFPYYSRAFRAISDLYFQGGYIFNQIQLEEERDEAQQQINFTVQITESGRAHIENIIIRGNTKTRDDVILRELQFEEGDVFSAGRIREGIANLYNTQFFADVPAIETPQGSVPGLMNLIINLEEGQTTDLRLGVSFALDAEIPIVGVVKWGDSNFLGNGQTIEAELNISQYEQSLQFSFFDPWLFGDRWSGGIGINLSRNVQTQELQDIMHPIFHKDDPVIASRPLPRVLCF